MDGFAQYYHISSGWTRDVQGAGAKKLKQAPAVCAHMEFVCCYKEAQTM